MFASIKSLGLKNTVSLDKKLKQSAQEDDEYLQFISNVTDTYKKIEQARSKKDIFRELVLYYQYEKLLAEGKSILVNTFQQWQDSKTYDHVPEAEEFYVKALNFSYLTENLRHFVDPSKYPYSNTENRVRSEVFRSTQRQFIHRNSPKFMDNSTTHVKNTILSKKSSFTYTQKNLWCEFYTLVCFKVYLIVDPKRSHLKPDFIFSENAFTREKWHRKIKSFYDSSEQDLLDNYRQIYCKKITTISEIKKYQQLKEFNSLYKKPRMNEVMPSISAASILCFAAEKDNELSLQKAILANYLYRSCLSDTFPQFNELWKNYPPLYILNPTPKMNVPGLEKFTEDKIASFLSKNSIDKELKTLFQTHPQIFSDKISSCFKKISLRTKTITPTTISTIETKDHFENKSIPIQINLIFSLAFDLLKDLDLVSEIDAKTNSDQYSECWRRIDKNSRHLFFETTNATLLPSSLQQTLTIFKQKALQTHHLIPTEILLNNAQLIGEDELKQVVVNAFNSFIKVNHLENLNSPRRFEMFRMHGIKGKDNAKAFMEEILSIAKKDNNPRTIYCFIDDYIRKGPGNMHKTSFKKFLKDEISKLSWCPSSQLREILTDKTAHTILCSQ